MKDFLKNVPAVYIILGFTIFLLLVVGLILLGALYASRV